MKTRKKLMLVVTLIFVMSFVLGNVAYAYAINNKALNTSYAQVAPNQMKTATTSTMHVSRFVGDSQTNFGEQS